MKKGITTTTLVLLIVAIIAIAAVAYYITLPPPAPSLKVCVAFDVGGRGDKSFCDAAYLGAMIAKEEFGVEVDEITPLSLAETEDVLRTLSEEGEYDLILCIGWLWGDALNVVADEFPDQKYMGIDVWLPEKTNVLSVIFKAEQGCVLVGALAALLTESGIVGYVSGMELPLLWAFEIGYKMGVEYVENMTDKEVDVLWDYTMYFDRPDLGRESAITMLDAGADVIFPAAGETGLGALDAVAERGVAGELPFVIWVDANGDWLKPGRVIASMRKMVDLGTYTSIKMVVEGTFEGGGIILGIEEGGIRVSDLEDLEDWLADPFFAEMAETETGLTTEEILAIWTDMREAWATVNGIDVWEVISELEQKIINGELVPPAPTIDTIDYYRARYG